jgi:glycine/D-amino acid oxidase-like deaminating enzyme
MDLTSPRAFWLLRNGVGDVPPPLPADRRCEVLVIGAGITGALVADALTADGRSVIVIDRRQPTMGSTSASTALLQYEIDTHLVDLSASLGHAHAVAAYQACLRGVRAIARIARGLDEDVGFRQRGSLYYASSRRDARTLATEGQARQAAGLPCEILAPDEIAAHIDLDAPRALFSPVGGDVDPWRLARALFSRCAGRDFSLHGRTEALDVAAARDGLIVRTDRGLIRARHVVVATGYEAERFLPKRVCKLHSSFALVTEPVGRFHGWRSRCLVWESARPYLYLRSTDDGRVLIGGEDIPFKNAVHRDLRVPGKAATLLKKARRLLPKIDLEPAFAWGGTFGETKDGLAYIGPHPARDPRLLFALGYGGNGITYSAVAAEIIAATVGGRRHRHRDTFRFDR